MVHFNYNTPRRAVNINFAAQRKNFGSGYKNMYKICGCGYPAAAMHCLRLFGHAFLHGYRNGHRGADHGVVAHADEAHHLDVRGYGGGTCELRVGVHPAHGVGHAVAGRARSHVVGVERSARAAARCNGEVLLAVFVAPLFIGARNGVLEARGVGGVAGDGYRYVFHLHDGDAFGNAVCAVALYLGPAAFGEGDGVGDLYRFGVGVELRPAIGETVDAGDDVGRILAKTVEYYAKGLYAHLVGVFGYLYGTLCGGEGFVPRKEAEAVGVFMQEHGAEIAVAEADLPVFGYRTGNAETLQADAYRGGSVGCLGAALLYCDGGAHGVCPNRVFKTDGLGAADYLVAVHAL